MVHSVVAVGNRIRDHEDVEYLKTALEDIPLIGTLPESDKIRRADRDGLSPYGIDPKFTEGLHAIAAALVNRANTQ